MSEKKIELSEKIAPRQKVENPKVSIIVPIYNVEKYLEKCLFTLTNQTLEDIEIVCVNDGSKDNSASILEEFSNKDNRIKVIEQKNAGLSAARNTGLKHAIGDYIGFLDSDDWVDLNYYEALYNAITKNNCDISMATIIRKRENSQKYRVHYTKEEIFEELEDKIKSAGIPKCCYVWNKLYKKEFVLNSNFKEGVLFEDMLWLPEIIKNADRICTVPDCNHYYRVNQNSIVKTLPSIKKQDDLYNSKKYIVQFFNENNLKLSEKDKNITKRQYFFFNIPILKIKEYSNNKNNKIPRFNN